MYQNPKTGFRWEVTAAAIKALKEHDGVCPSCGEVVTRKKFEDHAEDCLALRADVADSL